MGWKNFGEMSTDDGHKVYFSGEEDRHEYGWISCAQGHSERCLRMPTSLQKTDLEPLERNSFQHHHHIQVYASTTGQDDNKVDHFHQQL